MLLEKTVQKRALGYLETYYNNRFLRRKIFTAEEVTTKRTYGGKRADGLLVFQGRITGKPYVVSMEAKSIKTLPAIEPYQDMQRWWYNSLRFGLFVGLGSGLLYLAGQAQTVLDILLPIIWSLFAGIAFGLLTWRSYRHKTVDVITQLKQYPANEQWLAFSKDAFLALTVPKQQSLSTICKYRGVGLLLIGKGKEIQLLNKPDGRWYWFWDSRIGWQWISDFLIYYSREKEIRRAI